MNNMTNEFPVIYYDIVSCSQIKNITMLSLRVSGNIFLTSGYIKHILE